LRVCPLVRRRGDLDNSLTVSWLSGGLLSMAGRELALTNLSQRGGRAPE